MLQLAADTDSLVWHLTEPKRLGKAARRSFTSSDRGREIEKTGTCLVISPDDVNVIGSRR